MEERRFYTYIHFFDVSKQQYYTMNQSFTKCNNYTSNQIAQSARIYNTRRCYGSFCHSGQLVSPACTILSAYSLCIFRLAYQTRDCIRRRHQILVIRTEVALEMLAIFNHLLYREYFINFNRHESFRSYISKLLDSWEFSENKPEH